MPNQARQGFAWVAIVVSALACAGQSVETRDTQTALNHQEDRVNHECVGPVCGPSTLARSLVLAPTEYVLNEPDQRAHHECLGPICGAEPTPAWTLETPRECLATICGPGA